jgi:hypothetical protein
MRFSDVHLFQAPVLKHQRVLPADETAQG